MHSKKWVSPIFVWLQGAKGPFVWVVNDKRQAEQRLVKTGAWVGSDWQIRSGLAEGDEVIVDNLLKLKVGSPLQIQPGQAQPAQARTAQP